MFDSPRRKSLNSPVNIIAFRDDGWMPPNTDYRMWDHICRAYGADLQMVRYWEEAELPEGYKVVLVDEAGTDVVGDFEYPEKASYVFGRTHLSLPASVPGDDFDYVLRINTPRPISFFGVSAVAIVLEDRQKCLSQ